MGPVGTEGGNPTDCLCGGVAEAEGQDVRVGTPGGVDERSMRLFPTAVGGFPIGDEEDDRPPHARSGGLERSYVAGDLLSEQAQCGAVGTPPPATSGCIRERSA